MAKNFEDLECWKQAMTLDKSIFNLVNNTRISFDTSLKSQMLRSVGSVADNIAEGFERNGTKEFVQFLYIAKGSCGELRSQLHRAFSRNYISEQEFNDGISRCRSNSIKIMHFIVALKSSGLAGDKYRAVPKS